MIRAAGAAEVIWTYIANEHASKHNLGDVVARLHFDAEAYPEGLSVNEILTAVVGREVHETARQLSELCWESRSICVSDLRHVHAQVPDTPLPASRKTARPLATTKPTKSSSTGKCSHQRRGTSWGSVPLRRACERRNPATHVCGSSTNRSRRSVRTATPVSR